MPPGLSTGCFPPGPQFAAVKKPLSYCIALLLAAAFCLQAAADNLDFYLNSWHGSVETLDGGMEAPRAISDFDYSLQRCLWKWRPEQPR